jgi:hypothetical protein
VSNKVKRLYSSVSFRIVDLALPVWPLSEPEVALVVRKKDSFANQMSFTRNFG